jgi:hypothetical protein
MDLFGKIANGDGRHKKALLYDLLSMIAECRE